MSREMKDSGVDWMGEIPEQWTIKKLKYIFSIKKDIANELGHEILSVTQSGLKKKDISKNEGQISADYSKYQLVDFDDFVMNHMDLLTGWIDCSQYQGVTSPDYRVFKLFEKENQCKDFYTYLFQTCYKNKVFYGLGQGVSNLGRWRLQSDKFLDFMLPSLPRKEQQRIAAYLDQKCAEIDNVIENTKVSVEEYKAYKQSIITEAVTKGLNPNAPMKESGVEWIGEIPKQWDLVKFKKITKGSLQYGANASGIEYSDELPRYIRITDISSDNKLKNDNKLSLPISEAEPYILVDNDILFARSGATVGKTFFYKKEYGYSAFAGYLIKASIIDDVNPRFIYYFTLSSAYNEWKNRIFIQSTIQNIGADKYSNMEVVIPSTSIEQQQIVEYLDGRCNKIDSLISPKIQIISELESYKKSLIYECVTGKKEV